MQPLARRAPLSFAQQRLWFLDQLEPGSSLYNIPRAFQINGPLNVAALEQSINEIVHRHESLRTTFAAVEGSPVQVITPNLSVAVPVVDLSKQPASEGAAEVHRLVTEEAQHPFDLARGPLLRASLLRLDEEEHVLLLNMHHIVSDAWSASVLFRELATFYKAFSKGKSSPLPDLPIQYADYAVWQREWLQGEVLERQLVYWKERLSGAPSVLELPTDRPRPAVQSYHGAKQRLVLSKSLTEALKALSRAEGATLFMTLLAAFQTLLARYTNQEDIVVGSPIAGRTRDETEGLIGFFVNTLVLRTDVSGNPTFRELLRRVREVACGAYAHQDLPFEKLVGELQPERNLSRHLLFDVMLNFINTPQATLKLPDLTFRFLELAEPQSKLPITLYAWEQEGELVLCLVYQRILFSAERMACLLNQFQYLLDQIVTAPENPIRSYSLVTPESAPLLPDPKTVLPEPRYGLVTDMFLAWANRTPQQTAICQGQRAWTYCELADSVYALARTLLAQGLKRGDVVAVFGPRSAGLIASMTAVLLSRGVLLTIDRNLPVYRQRLMLQEAGAKHLLYVGDQRPEDEWVRELSSLVITRVNPNTGRTIEPEWVSNFEVIHLPELAPDDAAYIFFTSGTTGVPKGVLGCHKGLSHFLSWQRETFAVGPRDRCAQLTGLSFDPVLRDIFLPLTSGATLCLPEEVDELGPGRIMPWLERERISLLHTVPALAQSWLINLPRGVSLRALRWLFFAGEPLTEALVRRWRQAFPEAGEIVNLYGPTETTLVKCFYRVPPDIPAVIQPAGWPLPDTQALILAENGQLCGIGEVGEIVLRTPFRTLGYINAQQENEERFFKNPFREDEGDLLYRTGDRGYYRVDGSIGILGRLDRQVKIRGNRIELSEVEAMLSGHPAVHESVVVARGDIADEKRLVAYFVAKQGQAPTVSELCNFFREKLPDYMVPSAFVMLEAMPLTPNGKVDRRALPAPDAARPELDRAFVAPRTPVEEVIAGIWSKVLGVEQVGVDDNFFELGGHSLLATQVISRVCTALKVELPLRSVFETPTVAGLAERIEIIRWAAQDAQQFCGAMENFREEGGV